MRKNVVGVLVLAVLVVGFLWYLGNSDDSYDRSGNSLAVSENPSGLPTRDTVDSDRDGLENWEEALWKTDPNNPDTDGDGTRDGQEVTDYRDPTDPSTNDSLQKIEEGVELDPNFGDLQPYFYDADAKQNNTEAFAINILDNIIRSHATGQRSEDRQLEIFSTAMGSLTQTLTNEKTQGRYEERHLKSIVSSNDESVKEYANWVASVLKFNLTPPVGEEENLLTEILSSQGATINSSLLNTIVEKYEAASLMLSQVATPEDLVNVHLNLMNSLYSMGSGTEKTAKADTDPLSAFMGVGEYRMGRQSYVKTIDDIERLISARGITFSDDDPGILFTLN